MIPSALRACKNWLVWKLKQVEGEPKPRKVPYYTSGPAREGVQGGAEDRALLSTYDEAQALVAMGLYDGLGFAFTPDCGIVGLDFDHCVAEDGVIDARVLDVTEGMYTELSPSGTGVHAFALGALKSRKDNAGKKLRVGGKAAPSPRLDGKFDIEFFGTNGFLTITDKQTPDSEIFGWDITELNDRVLTLYKERFGAGANATGISGPQDGVDSMEGVMPSLGWTVDEAKGYLGDLDPDTDRDTWLKVLMAIHHEFDGSDEALDLVDEWSSGASSYAGRGDVEGRWRSFKQPDRNPITGRWLLFLRSEQLKRQKYSAEDEYVQIITATSDPFVLREKVAIDISRDERLDEAARGQLARAMQAAFKSLGKVYPIADVRKMLKPTVVRHAANEDAPDWLGDWVYICDEDRFFKRDSAEYLSIQGFNMTFTRFMPKDPATGDPIKEAAAAAREDYNIEVVTRAQYVPWAPPLFTEDGVYQVNTYRPSSVPQAVAHLSDDGRRAVEVMKQHLSILCNGRQEIMATLLDWIAHNTQFPGVKIRWAPLIKGIEGDGKTLLGTLLAAVMGRANVKNVSSTVLGTDFTAWAVGSAVAVLEEVKLTGHNRYDILNAVKPMIANSVIEVHKKGKDADGNVINVTNYICFTNFNDALPLGDTDRRYMVVFSPHASVSGLAAAIRKACGYVGSDDEVFAAYFDLIHDAISLHAAELRRWLLDHKISKNFYPNGRAPMTDEKLVMIGMNISDGEHILRDILDTGGYGITADLFSSGCLTNMAAEVDTDFALQTSQVPKLLSKMGYTRMPIKVKWDGKAHVIWTKNAPGMSNEEVRAVLDGTRTSGLGTPPDDCLDLFS